LVTAISYHDRVNVLQGLALASASPFERFEWFDLLASDGGLKPLVALARDGEEALALPLMRAGDALIPLANWYSFTWRVLASKGANAAELAEALARALTVQARRITLFPVPDEEGSAELLTAAFRAAGWQVIAEQCDTNHVLRIDGRSYAEYLASRPGPLRTTLERKAKKLEVAIHTAFDFEAWDHYEAIYAASWKPAEGRPAMLRRFAQQEGAAGRLRLAIARHGGVPVAAQFWTVEDGTAYIHKLAHTDEGAPLSAGTVLTAALMRHVIDVDKVAVVDFGTGDDAYKGVWMEEIRPRYRLDCLLPGNPRNWLPLGKAALRKLASR
jgi:hypothetical protein